MPRPAKLKVFRTPIGFHDAYVAAPSQKAAIEAWGSDRDVFRRGEAEEVTDPELTKAPLAAPGKVVKALRGTPEEQLAALPPNRPKKPRRTKDEPVRTRHKAAPRSNPVPRPSRGALDKAEEAIEAAETTHAAKLDALRKKEAALAKERAKLEREKSAEIGRLRDRRDRESEKYESALAKWRAS